MYLLIADAGSGEAMGMLAVAIFLGAMVYLAPTLIAMMRGHPNAAPIIVVNVFLGWCLIGWVVALAWAVSAVAPRPRSRYAASRARDGDNPFA